MAKKQLVDVDVVTLAVCVSSSLEAVIAMLQGVVAHLHSVIDRLGESEQ